MQAHKYVIVSAVLRARLVVDGVSDTIYLDDDPINEQQVRFIFEYDGDYYEGIAFVEESDYQGFKTYHLINYSLGNGVTCPIAWTRME